MTNLFYTTLICCLFIPWKSNGQCSTVNAGEDIYLCAPATSTQLNGSISGGYTSFEWTPTTGLSNFNSLNPTVVNLTQPATYVLTAIGIDNLVFNGDFESGNTGFTSDYIEFDPCNASFPAGRYIVFNNTPDLCFSACADHTSGDGNVMCLHCGGTPGAQVWCQTVNVDPNTDYVFSAWFTNPLPFQFTELVQYSINGSPIGSVFSGATNCVWSNHTEIWNSGSNTTADICILDQTFTPGPWPWHGFYMDDISFGPLCVNSDTVQLFPVDVTAVATPGVISLPCSGASYSLNGTGSSTGPDVSYLWETSGGNILSGETTLTPMIGDTGLYTLTVTRTNPDGSVCIGLASVTALLDPTPFTVGITPPVPLGCDSDITTLFGYALNPGTYAYAWSTPNGNIVSGADQKNCVVNQPGSYNLIVTNTITGCTATTDTDLDIIPFTVWITPPAPLSCGSANTALVSNSSDPGTYSYAWSTTNGNIVSGANQKNCVVNQPGTYNLTVTNTVTGCTATTDTELDDVSTPLLALATVSDTLTCLQDTVILSSSGSSIGGNISYSWTTVNGHFISAQNTATALVDTSGIYVLHVTDISNNCSSRDTISVIENLLSINLVLQPQQQITCKSDTIAITINLLSNVLINWTASNGGHIVSGQNTPNPVVDSTGDYSIILQDTLTGCISRDTVHMLLNNQQPVAVILPPGQLTCQSLNIALSGNVSSPGNSFIYHWTASNGGHIISGDSSLNPLVNAGGNYTLSVLDTLNGCSGTASTAVATDTNFVTAIAHAPDTITCAVQIVQLNTNGSTSGPTISYVWSTQDGHILSGADSPNPVVDSAGTYQLLMTNSMTGCFGTSTVSVSENLLIPQVSITPPNLLPCADPVQNLLAQNNSPSGHFTYAWVALNGGNISGSSTGISVLIDAAGTYILSTTNSDNGCMSFDTVTILDQSSAPMAEAGLPDTITCVSAQVSLIANGPNPPAGLNYQWATTNGSFNGVTNAAQVEGLSPGLYFVTVTDPTNGCTAVDSVQVFESVQPPSLSLATPDVFTCLQGTQTLQGQNQSPSGSFTYSWSASNGGNIVSGNNSLNPVVDAPGIYTLTAIDGSNGCTSTLSATVTQDLAVPDILATAPGQISCNNPVQTIQAQNLSLPGNFSYSWTATNGGHIVSGNNTLSLLVDAAGDYSLMVTNLLNGCSSSVAVNIFENISTPSVDAGSDAILTCSLNSLTLNGSGSPGITYSWTASSGGNITSGASTPTPLIDSPGIYTLTVSNPANGCSSSDSVEIFNDAGTPAADAGTAPQLSCSLIQTQLNATASQGPDFSYQWTATGGGNILSGPGSLTPVVDAPGVYTLVVTNAANGCTHSSTVTVTEDIKPPVVDAGVNGLLTCSVTSINLSGAQSGGSATYLWQTAGGNIVSGATSLTPAINQPGTYTLTATLMANGCTGSDVVTVAIDTISPIFSIQPPQVLTCTQQSIQLDGSVQQPGAGGFSASWSTANGHFVSGQNTLNATVDAPGTYILNIQDIQNGCDAVVAIPVMQNIVPPLAVVQAGGTITCATQSVTLDGIGSSIGNSFTYAWSTADGLILSGSNTLAPVAGSGGIYTLEVTDITNGCTTIVNTTVPVNTIPPTIAIAQPELLTCVQNSVTVNGAGSSTGANFNHNWTTTTGNILSGQGTLIPVVNQPGDYVLTIQDSQNGCSASQQVLVSQNITTPGAEAGTAEELHCNRLQVNLHGSSPTGGNMAYLWASIDGHIVSGATNQLSTVDAPGMYSLTVTNPVNGCTAMDNVTVNAVPAPDFDPALIQPDCHTLIGSIDFGAIEGGQAPFRFSIDGGQIFENQAFVADLLPGIYALVVQDDFGCSASETVSIEPPLIPSLNIEELDLLEFGDSVLLRPVTNVLPGSVNSWSWSPVTGLSCSDCETPWAQPVQNTLYDLLVTDVNGCSAQAQVLVSVDQKRHVFAPNVFSPNGDGLNEFFMIFGKGIKEIRTLQIYDRWGEALFFGEHLQANEEQAGWNGNYQGDPMNPGVFVWVAEIEFIDGQRELFKGDVTIVR